MSGQTATWCSKDPRTGAWTQYSGPVARQLEREYQAPPANREIVRVTIDNAKFGIDVTEMLQSNATGGTRELRRKGATAGGVWYCTSPHHQGIVPYTPEQAAKLEAAHQRLPSGGSSKVPFAIGTSDFVADVREMKQYNADGNYRLMARHDVVWYSISPQHGDRDPYALADSVALEAAFQRFQNGGSPKVPFALGTLTFTVDLREMKQYNADGLYRSVVRDDSASASATPAATAPPMPTPP